MSNIPWRILKTGHPRAHLVAGAMQTDQPEADSDLNKICARIDRLVKKLEPIGAYATMIVADISSPGVHLAFELEGDARRFGAAVNAEVSEGYPGWATQQSFLLSDVSETALEPSLAPPVTMRPPRNNLKRDIEVLGQTIEANALILKSKTLNDDDREALQRQMTTRLAHQKLLQQRLDRLQASGG
jgi:hypothetical protein